MRPFAFRTGTWDFSRTYIAGVVNVTPDSFSDGGQFRDPEAARTHGLALVEAGADLLDIGGESTRPGADAVSLADELDRVLPVVEGLATCGVPLSVDTTKAEVARRALAAGAEVINDISGGLFEPEITRVVDEEGGFYVCGHARGTSIAEIHRRQGESPGWQDVAFELGERLMRLPADLRQRTILDPGLGFGKQMAANLELCKGAGRLSAALQCPVMIGASRKRFVAELSGREAPVPVTVRDAATVGASLAAAASGAHVLRVHDVERLAPALRAFERIIAGTVREDG